MIGTHTNKKKRDVPHIFYEHHAKGLWPWVCGGTKRFAIGNTACEAYKRWAENEKPNR